MLATAVVLAVTAQAHAADGDAMARAANGFYAAYSTFHNRIDGVPDATARLRFTPVVSDRLNALLTASRAAEEKFTNAYKDSPPLIEGDLFTSNYEGATSYKVGDCAGDGKTGHCAIALTYDPRTQGDAQNKPVHWTDTAYLVNTPSGWKLDDIGYGGSWDFSNKGRMSDALKMVLATAGNGSSSNN
jgi:hypothetical protein